jgi:hypothetical protein
VLGGGQWSASFSGRLIPAKKPRCVYLIGAVWAPEPICRALEERESFAPCRVWNPGPSSQQSVAIPTELSRLRLNTFRRGKIFGTKGVNEEEHALRILEPRA